VKSLPAFVWRGVEIYTHVWEESEPSDQDPWATGRMFVVALPTPIKPTNYSR